MGGRVVLPVIQCSVGCGLWLLWHLGPDIILDWMEQIGNKKLAVWAGLSLNGHGLSTKRKMASGVNYGRNWP